MLVGVVFSCLFGFYLTCLVRISLWICVCLLDCFCLLGFGVLSCFALAGCFSFVVGCGDCAFNDFAVLCWLIYCGWVWLCYLVSVFGLF